jgi:hypothetical protein
VEAAIQALVSGVIYVVTTAVVVWTAGALYYDVGRASRFAWVLIFIWIAAVVTLLVAWSPLWKPFLLVMALFGLFLSWWFSQQPSNDRNWDPTTALLPKIEISEDAITIVNLRDTEFQVNDICVPFYDTRNFRLSQLCGLDVLLSIWGKPQMSHPIFIFDFGVDGRVGFSIEVRYRQGQKYRLLPSLYRQHELIYLVCDERDLLLRRTKHSQEQDVYLYRITATQQEVLRFFMEYVEQVNDLIDSPRWYHGLTTNCTTSIYAQREGEMIWDWRLMFNGKVDQMLYDRQRLDRSIPFETLKQESRVNEIANQAPQENFGDFLRSELFAYQSKPQASEEAPP